MTCSIWRCIISSRRRVRVSSDASDEQHLHVAGDQIQRRADLMRDVGGGLSDRGELLGLRERFAQVEDPLIHLFDVRVAGPELRGGVADPRLQRLAQHFHLGRACVQPADDRADLVRPLDLGARPQSRLRDAPHRLAGCAPSRRCTRRRASQSSSTVTITMAGSMTHRASSRPSRATRSTASVETATTTAIGSRGPTNGTPTKRIGPAL